MSLDTLLDSLINETSDSNFTENCFNDTKVTLVTPSNNKALPLKQFKNNKVALVTPVTFQKVIPEKQSTITNKQEAIIKEWLFHIGEPEEDHFLVLNNCRNDPEALAYYLERVAENKREERYKKVLVMLADRPETQRAFITDMSSDPDNVIIAIGIRDQYTFEIQIPTDKYDAFMLLELIEKGSIQ